MRVISVIKPGLEMEYAYFILWIISSESGYIIAHMWVIQISHLSYCRRAFKSAITFVPVTSILAFVMTFHSFFLFLN